MIHYHGLPMWPQLAILRAMRGRHAMVSYERPEQIEAATEGCQSIVLDNGTFPAWKKGRSCDLSGYRDWAQYWLKHPAVDWAVTPDIIDGGEAESDALLREWDRIESHASVRRWSFGSAGIQQNIELLG